MLEVCTFYQHYLLYMKRGLILLFIQDLVPQIHSVHFEPLLCQL